MQQTRQQKRKLSGLPLPSARGTVKSRQSSKERSRSKDRVSKEKMEKKLVFESPRNKECDGLQDKNLSLLNYLILREKIQKINGQHSREPVTRHSFNTKCVIGKGGFGKVWKVEYKKSKVPLAMKQMSKAVIITKKSVPSVMNERYLLAQLKHPFLVNMVFAFQDRDNLYLIMDLMPGGDLRFHISEHQFFREEVVKFFTCCIVIGLEYLHTNGIIHRDIKPQNLVIDNKGYLRITDLGVARMTQPDNYQDTSGTPGYMAPEVINRENHSFPVDYFALGVIVYECMFGRRPYRGRNRKQIREDMMSKEIEIKRRDIPDGWSVEAADFVNRLLRRKQQQRLGTKGIEEIKKHPWLASVNWNRILQKGVHSPYVPNFTVDNFDDVSDTEEDEETRQKLQQNKMLLRRNPIQSMFEGYEFQQVSLY